MYIHDNEFGSSHGVAFSGGHNVLSTEGSHFMLLFTDVGIFHLVCILYYGYFKLMCFVMCGCRYVYVLLRLGVLTIVWVFWY